MIRHKEVVQGCEHGVKKQPPLHNNKVTGLRADNFGYLVCIYNVDARVDGPWKHSGWMTKGPTSQKSNGDCPPIGPRQGLCSRRWMAGGGCDKASSPNGFMQDAGDVR
jgi:hypothetical protein